jgi:pimeloyl-ACP methyl ester carboxylesterase
MKEDLKTVLNHVRGISPAPIGAYAYSAGTSVALLCATELEGAISSIAMWGLCFNRFYSSYYSDVSRAESQLAEMGTAMASDFSVTPEMLPENLVPRLAQPMFFGYGSRDSYGSLAECCSVFEQSQNPANTLFVLRGGTHALDRRHSGFPAYANAIANWFTGTL